MDTPPAMSSLAPRHFLFHQRSPSPSPTRQRVPDDLLSDLSPATTLEAFTTPNRKLSASVEAASPTERAFGMRATLASKKIQEWLDEISTWPWPEDGGSAGFETPPAKRRKVSVTPLNARNGRHGPREEDEGEYVGSLRANDVIRFETRVEEIHEDMEELNVEEIKTKVLDTFSAKSRPSTPRLDQPLPSLFSSYTRMDDFTAVVTATVLRALPNLSRLMRLMDVWSIRLTVLRKVPPLLHALDDAEIALKSGWDTIQMFEHTGGQESEVTEQHILTRSMFDIMRDVLQDKVTLLGQELDFLLDTLEGREDTLPDSWLDRMEVIEQDYGSWVVSGDRKVREGEWARSAHARKVAEDERQVEAEKFAAAEQERMQEEEARKADELSAARQHTTDEQATEDTAVDGCTKGEYADKKTQSVNAQQQQDDSDNEIWDGSVDASFADVVHTENEQDSGAEEFDMVNQDSVMLSPIAEDESSPPPEQRTFDISGISKPRFETESKTDISTSKAEDGFASKASSQRNSPTITARKIVPGAIGSVTGAVAATTGLLNKEPEEHEATISGIGTTPESSTRVEAAVEVPRTLQTPVSIPTSDTTTPISEYPSVIPLDLDDESSASVPGPVTPQSRSSSVKAQGRRWSIPHTPVPGSSARKASSHRNSYCGVEDRSPISLSEISRSGHGFDKSVRSSASQQFSPDLDISSTPKRPLQKSIFEFDQENLPQHVKTPSNDSGTPFRKLLPSPILIDGKNTSEAPEAAKYDDGSESTTFKAYPQAVRGSTTPKAHRRNASSVTVSGYETSVSTSQIQEAEPSDYFNYSLTSERSPSQQSLATNSELSFDIGNSDEPIPSIETSDFLNHDSEPSQSAARHTEMHTGQFDGSYASKPHRRRKSEHILEDFTHEDDHKSVLSASSSFQDLFRNSEDSRPESAVSDSSTVLSGQTGSAVPSPSKESFNDTVISTPASDGDISQGYPGIDISSPSAGRMGARSRFYDRSPSGTPEPAIRVHKNLMQNPAFIPSPEPESRADGVPSLAAHSSTPSTVSNPSASQSTDDHMQQQISSLLDTLPAKIHLTSEAETTPPATYSVRSKKSRSRLTPNLPRSHSSMSSSRSPTPYLTLAPAYAKNPRPRPNNSNPDIKVYHLSRSTGEAPIRLFVRLVGENGERVMVRVGGGWADLGEYLKEYAAHHGRRPGSGIDPENLGKVEIQDLPPRMVTSGSLANLRNGRDSPASRPASAMERSSSSSLTVRKARKSLGVGDDIQSSLSSLRSPSTPLQRSVQIPRDRSSSKSSWMEDDGGSLGLAGPKGKRKEQDLSAENVIWVEGMKEKVRQASAEKEKLAREKERKEKFGEMDKAGGTKRLFPKGTDRA
ncbi:GAS2 domain-containing protein [Phlyctema vagabunda]|uniref:GAS2 domain-containing protein n=1 Tax=Phlyctema vagabunda TaxID=108571 RepID=A0ABR4PHF1_9HELO